MGVSRNGVTPTAGWFRRENTNLKWMIARGTPISGNHHIVEIEHYHSGDSIYCGYHIKKSGYCFLEQKSMDIMD